MMTVEHPPRNYKRRDRKLVATIPDRYKQFLDGTLTVDDLDDEEIMRGQLRNSQGDFRGRNAKFLPRELMLGIIQKRDEIFASKIMPAASDAIDNLKRVSKTSTVHDGPGVQASKILLAYAIGNPVEKVQINAHVEHKYDHIVESSLRKVGEDVEDEL